MQVVRIFEHKPLPGGTKASGPYEYLVLCAKDGSMEGTAPRPRDRKWRCRDCYAKVSTSCLRLTPAHCLTRRPCPAPCAQDPVVWAAYNEPTVDTCRACGKHVSECGFLHWLKFDELPKAKREAWLRSNAPPLLQTLRTRFPRAKIDVDHRDAPALWG